MATRKIALEEAFTTPGLGEYLDHTLAVVPSAAKAALTELLENTEKRIQSMDEGGVELFVLSQTSPGVQIEKNPALAIERARHSNDFLQAQIKLHPTRFRGFAHLAMQDATAAADELERCVRDLGFVGAMINGQTLGKYLDNEMYFPFWERVSALKVPVYMHPADPFVQPHVIADYPEMQGAMWGWSFDNSTHFLRMVLSGLFDRYPDVTIILGHMGETLPYYTYRIDKRYADSKAAKAGTIKKAPTAYFKSNLVITTTGCCQDSALQLALTELGDDRVLFSVDYPYEQTTEAAEWIEKAPLSTEQREKICYKNAERVLKLS